MKDNLLSRVKIIAIVGTAVAFLIPATSCKVAPTVFPFDTFIRYSGTPLATESPYVISVFPDNNALNVPRNADYVVLFNIPIDQPSFDNNVIVQSSSEGGLTPGALADYEITWDVTGTIATIDFHYGPSSPLMPEGDVVQVTLPATITAAAPLTGALTNAGTRQFTVGTFSDTTAPTISAGTNNPTSPPTVEITVDARHAASPKQDIHIDFSEDINPGTIDAATFELRELPLPGVVVPATYTFVGDPLYRATLTPTVDLLPGTTYRVTVTAGMTDMAGNPLAAGTSWDFTTVPADVTDPTVDGGPMVDMISPTSAIVSWSTDEPTDYTFYYDRDNPPVNSYAEIAYSTYHAIEFEPAPVSDPLITNARYWFTFAISDLAGRAGAMPAPSPRQFNTESGETPDPVHQAAGNQLTARQIAWRPANGDPSGFFLFWIDSSSGNNALYGQRFDAALTGGWNAASPQPLFTETGQNFTYQSSVDDGVDGAIVLALRSDDNRVYAKRKLKSDGTLEWGHVPNGFPVIQGLMVRDAATTGNMYAVPVHTGVTQNVVASRAAPNTTEMGSMSLANHFFDDSVDLTGLQDGADVIMKETTHTGTTIDNNTAAQNFFYILGQDAAIVSDGDAYYIGDASSSEANTAADHQIMDTPATTFVDYENGPLDVYTPHGYSLPGGWTLGTGDIIESGGSYTRLSGNPISRTPITAANMLDSGTVDGASNNHLLNSARAWLTGAAPFPILAGDIVINVTDSLITTVAAGGVLDGDLTLDTPPIMNFDYVFPGPGDAYWIYDRYCLDHFTALNQFQGFYELDINFDLSIVDTSAYTVYDYLAAKSGTADARPTNPLYDNQGNFSGVPVNVNDLVINTTDSTAAAVTAATYQHALDLDRNIMADGENYFVTRFSFTPAERGRADGGDATHIVDSTKDFTLTVAAGDAAYNPATDQYAIVTTVAATQLTLSQAAGFGNNVYYAVFKRRVLYVFQDAGGIRGRIVSLDAPLTNIRGTVAAPFLIIAGAAPRAIGDGAGNAYVVYQTTVAPSQVRVLYLDGYGNTKWTVGGPLDVSALAAAETIVDVQSDNAGGIVILFRSGTDLYAQRVNSAGTSGQVLWGANGITVENDAALVTSQEVMRYVAPGDVIVAARTAGDEIWANRAGGTNWDAAGPTIGDAAANIVTNLPASVQNSPQLWYDGANVIVLWQDYRFLNPPAAYISDSADAVGLFGVKLAGATGAVDAAWYADATGASDRNGISIIFNHYNKSALVPLVAPFNAGAALVWEDFRYTYGGGENRDLVYIDLAGFTPP